MKNQLSKAFIKKEIFSYNQKTIKEFKRRYNLEINSFIDKLFETYSKYKAIDCKENSQDKQKALTAAFLYNSINNLMLSFKMILSSYLVVSGNLYRHYLESVLLAMIVSNNKLDKNYYKLFMKEGTKFQVHKVFNIIDRNKIELNIIEPAWKQLKEQKQFYNMSSHSSAFALSTIFDFSSGNIIFGAHFDADKIESYRKEMEIRINACNIIDNTIELVKVNFKEVIK